MHIEKGGAHECAPRRGGCVASLHCFSWVVAGEWRRIEHVRPNVPWVSSETGETIWCALYHVEAIEHYGQLELAGLKHAEWPFYIPA